MNTNKIYSEMKLKSTYIIALIVLVTITSCGTTLQHYERENPYSLERYRNSKAVDSTTIASINWRDFFKDPILIQHIDTALVYNLDLLRAQKNLGIAQSLVKQAKAAFLPSINGNVQAGYTRPSGESFNGKNLPDDTSFSDFSLGVAFNWEVDVWGKISSQKKAAVAQYYQTENAQRLIQSQLVNAVTNYYYTLQSLDAKKAIILTTIENRKESIEATQALKEAGSLTEVSVKQTEAQYFSSQAILLDIEYQINLTENALSVLLGKAPQHIERSDFPQTILEEEVLKTGFPIQLLNNRPDVLLAEYSLVQAVELTNVAQASFYPSLTITGSGGLNSENFSDLFNANALFGNIAGGLLQPIFNQRGLRTQKEVRQYEQQIALLDYKQNVLTAYQEVSNELSGMTNSKEKIVFKEQEKEALDKSLEYSELLLQQGFVNYLEILRARDLVLNAELEIIDLKLNQLSSYSNLYRALGGGWE